MNNIILAELLDCIYYLDIVKIYMEREHKSEGYKYLVTASPKDLLEDDEYIFLIDSNIRVTALTIMHDHDYGQVIEIIVRRINNES